jgi:hypothetical protein
MSANQAFFPIATMARVLGVSTAGYYAWRCRLPSARAIADDALLDECARSMLSRAALMVHLEFMPSCVAKVGQSARSGLPG